MIKNKHIIVRNYLENHSILASNITSFNNFIEHRMQEIVNEVNDSIKNDDFDLAISFESFQRDEYSIILKHGIPINFVGTLPITQVFYTKDGYTHFSYAHDRIPFKKKEVPR